MDLSDSDGNGSSHEEDMDYSDIEEIASSNAENMNSSGSEESDSSHPGDLDSSDAEDMDLSSDEESNANPTASSVTEYLRFCGPARRQNWALPDSIIFYIAKNPSTPKLYQKLIRTSKYFFLVNPIIICSRLALRCRKIDEHSEKEDSSNDEEINHALDVTDDYWEIAHNLVKKNGLYNNVNNKKIDLKNYSAKIWIVTSDDSEDTSFELHDSVTNRNIVSSIIPKIYRCNVKNLDLCNQNLSFALFSFLARSALEVWFFKVTVKYDDGTIVPVEKIVEGATKAICFYIELDDNDASISSETVKNLLEKKGERIHWNFSNIKLFRLENIPDSFDVETLFNYIKEHKLTSTELYFSDTISAAYKERLEKILDEIIEAGGRGGYKSPYFYFPGADKEKIGIMCKSHFGFYDL